MKWSSCAKKLLRVSALAFTVFVSAVGALTVLSLPGARGLPGGPPQAQQAPCANQTGDSNGDGGLDIADAVHTLRHLFSGGPAPVPLCNAQTPGSSQWPPAPSDIVNFDALNFSDAATRFNVRTAGSAILYNVPAERTLVITNFYVTSSSTGANLQLREFLPPAGNTVKRHGGVILTPYESSGTGLVFRAGSTVYLHNLGAQTTAFASFTGYLTDAP